MLAGAGIELPDTRAWRLRALAGTHPLVDALLTWRKAERVATTYGYAWLDEHLGADGRLRGYWTGSDGAAGRMTASAGLHNMPVEMRAAVVAEAGHVFVRADLGQIESDMPVLGSVLSSRSGPGRRAQRCGLPLHHGSAHLHGHVVHPADAAYCPAAPPSPSSTLATGRRRRDVRRARRSPMWSLPVRLCAS